MTLSTSSKTLLIILLYISLEMNIYHLYKYVGHPDLEVKDLVKMWDIHPHLTSCLI